MKKLLLNILATGAAAAVCAAQPANAKTVLRLSSWAPPTHLVNAHVWPEWGKALEKASNGTLSVKIEYNIASPPKQFGVVRDGIADAAWIFHGYNTRFVATQAVEMPGLGTSAEAAAYAYWKVYEKYLYKAHEHRGVKLIGLHSHGPAVIQTKEPLKKLDDLKGQKIRVPGGVGSLVGEALGVIAVKLPAPKVYEALSSGVADGIFMPVETQKSFRLMEVTKYVTEMPGGLYYGSFGFIMNPRTYAKLSKAEQKAVDETTGAGFVKYAHYWDDADVEGRKAAIASGTRFATASPEMTKAYYARVKPIEAAWEKKVAKWFDGKAALADLRKLARDYQAKMK